MDCFASSLQSLFDFHFGSDYVYRPVARLVIGQVGRYTFKKRQGGYKTVVGAEVRDGSPSNQHYYTLVSVFQSALSRTPRKGRATFL